MTFIIIGKNIDVTPGLKEAVEHKLGKLERYFTPDTEIHVTLSIQKDRQKISDKHVNISDIFSISLFASNV